MGIGNMSLEVVLIDYERIVRFKVSVSTPEHYCSAQFMQSKRSRSAIKHRTGTTRFRDPPLAPLVVGGSLQQRMQATGR